MIEKYAFDGVSILSKLKNYLTRGDVLASTAVGGTTGAVLGGEDNRLSGGLLGTLLGVSVPKMLKPHTQGELSGRMMDAIRSGSSKRVLDTGKELTDILKNKDMGNLSTLLSPKANKLLETRYGKDVHEGLDSLINRISMGGWTPWANYAKQTPKQMTENVFVHGGY